MLDLTTASEESQRILVFLLLVPVGTLITAVFRGVLGFRTIGTFSPTLLALSQTHSDWRLGAVVFAVAFGVGSFGRWVLVRANLSMVTRRGIIVTCLVMLFAAMVVLNERLGLVERPRSIILPVTIITLMIDRFFTITSADGQRIAWIVLGNTALLTASCFMLFAYTPVGSIFLAHPWLEVIVLGGLVGLGMYMKQPLMQLPAGSDESNS
jgi:hypothetical protein